MPMPPSHGWIVFHTPSEPSRIFCPMPNSIRNNGIPSRINITKNGIKKAPKKNEKKENRQQSIGEYSFNFGYLMAYLLGV